MDDFTVRLEQLNRCTPAACVRLYYRDHFAAGAIIRRAICSLLSIASLPGGL